MFVDGENFRHSIVELFPDKFHQEDYLPKSANWGELFDWIVAQSTDGVGKRIRTYWYVTKEIDFFPYNYNFPETKEPYDPNDNNIKDRLTFLYKILCHHEPYQNELSKYEGLPLLKKMQECSTELKERQSSMQRRFNGWGTVHNGISLGHKSIEFRRAGAISYDLFTCDLGKEKAVDVQLATDLIKLSGI
ncbi:MAG: hypothetical protein PHO26_10105, partial [Dehalococcoidia bacterium]|nr:hypothetical protein [Dehalococcoidia bacterium]